MGARINRIIARFFYGRGISIKKIARGGLDVTGAVTRTIQRPRSGGAAGSGF
jgi:hypothetical protein